ncbi:MAG TPA: protein kinase [Labilithrix sp.]
MAGAVDALGLVGTTVEAVRFDACVDSGGFGLVYRGVHTGLDEPVAVKCLRIAGLNTSNEALREAIAGRFRDETKLLYRLSQGHLDIVRCIGSGTLVAPKTNELTPYMVLEWLEGHSLGVDLRDRRDRALPPRSLEETIGLLDTAASALAYAHAQAIVHRDIKPGNLFLTQTREGVRVKVLDFGLAKILDNDSLGVQPSVLTGAGVHFCSPSYGAPEQLNAKIGPIGPWTDIYSLVLVMLEVMKGEKVRPATSLAEGLMMALDPATGSPAPTQLGLSVPPAVEDLFVRAVSQKPLERPRDAGSFWSALKEAVRSSLPKQPVRARSSRPPGGPDFNATVADANVEQAMQRVRALQAASGKPSPFAGTMLMTNAPSGAPHLASPASTAPVSPPPMNAPGSAPMNAPGPGPMGSVKPPSGPRGAGPGPMNPGGPVPIPAPMPAPEIRIAPGGPAPSPLALSVVHAPSQPPPPGKSPSTSPMVAPMPPVILPANPSPPMQPPMAQPQMAQPQMAQPPMGQPPMAPSPMAPSPMGPSPMAPSPMGQAPMGQAPMGQPPYGAPSVAPGGPPQGRRPQSVPPPASGRAQPIATAQKGGGGLLALFVFVGILAIGGFAGWWFFLRHH